MSGSSLGGGLESPCLVPLSLWGLERVEICGTCCLLGGKGLSRLFGASGVARGGAELWRSLIASCKETFSGVGGPDVPNTKEDTQRKYRTRQNISLKESCVLLSCDDLLLIFKY